MKNKEVDDLLSKGYFVGIIDGANCKNLKASIANIAAAFKFPDYYGKNLDAFWDCINDLGWLEESNYLLLIENAREFMTEDSSDNKHYLTNMLDEVSKEWAKVHNHLSEDRFRHHADFKVIYT